MGGQVPGRVGAQRHEHSVREVQDVHEAVDQREPRRRQEVDGTECERAEGQREKDAHVAPETPSSWRASCGSLRSPTAPVWTTSP